FGIAKRCFKLMVSILEYSIHMQAKLIAAMAALHNFIHINDPDDANCLDRF
ncbi:hypothetical protein BJV74DRAFT_775200, partial [Russula compacta]